MAYGRQTPPQRPEDRGLHGRVRPLNLSPCLPPMGASDRQGRTRRGTPRGTNGAVPPALLALPVFRHLMACLRLEPRQDLRSRQDQEGRTTFPKFRHYLLRIFYLPEIRFAIVLETSRPTTRRRSTPGWATGPSTTTRRTCRPAYQRQLKPIASQSQALTLTLDGTDHHSTRGAGFCRGRAEADVGLTRAAYRD